MQKVIIRMLPNVLSSIRFPLGGIFAVMLISRLAGGTIPWWWLVICFILIALSDLLDGWIARNFDCQSNAGAILDVASDSFYIFLSLAVLNIYNIIPIWFTVIVILKLADFILSSRIFSAGKKGYFIFDFLGRFTAVGFYLLPVLAGIFPHTGILIDATLFLMFTAVCSSILRWLSFA